MDELIKSSRKETDKSMYLIELRQHPSEEQYIKIEHIIKATDDRSSIFINTNTLPDILETLYNFSQEIQFQKKSDWIKIRNQEDERLIVSFFLKGITIKDLSLTYRYEEKIIIDILVKNNIAIIDGIDIPKRQIYGRKKR